MRRYEATIEEHVGPFHARFDWQITVEGQEPMRRVELLAHGKDTKLAASARASLIAVLDSAPNSTTIDLQTDLKVAGRIASLAQTVIRRKADQSVAAFAANLQALIESMEAATADA
jgi:carbon monoxide dehydrogenase subunit G